MSKKIFFCLIILFLIQCTNSKEKDKYEIINLVLKNNVTSYGVRIYPKSPTIKDTDKFYDSLVNTRKLTYYLDSKLFKFFKHHLNNKKQIVIEDIPITDFHAPVDNIDLMKINTIPIKRIYSVPCSKDNIDNCDSNFTASYKLSNIAFNSDYSLAVIQVNLQCGSKCGKGIRISLKKINNKWTIVDEKLNWIS